MKKKLPILITVVLILIVLVALAFPTVYEKYSYSDYFRANKAVLVNLDKVVSVSPAFGGRFEATLKNDCKIIISRMYVPKFKEKLGI